MKCDDVQSLLIDAGETCDPSGRRKAMEHLADCESCCDAQYAAGMLRVERARAIPPPSRDALKRAIAAATRGSYQARAALRTPKVSGRGGFWAGLAVGGGSVAAAAAVAWFVFVLPPPSSPMPDETAAPAAAETATMPEVQLALYQPRDVSISVDTASPLRDAEIRVVLTGSISLDGFEDRRELRWRTNLEAGPNQLTLPVVATDLSGGQLLVEVQHGRKRRTFIVDVHGA